MWTTRWPQPAPQSKRVSFRAAVWPYIRATAALDGMKGDNEDQTTGIQIVKRAIEEPLRQIVENAGGEGSVVVNKVKEGKDAFGYNARDDKYEGPAEGRYHRPDQGVACRAGECRFDRFDVPDDRVRAGREESPTLPPCRQCPQAVWAA